MKEIILNKLDQRWKNVVMDGTKPPVNRPLRKQLNHLIKNQPNHVVTTTIAITPLVMVIYFEEGAIPINPPQPRVMKKNNDESLSNQIINMKLINDSSPPTGNPIIIDSSPVKVDILANVLSPLINFPTIIHDNLPPIDDDQTKDNLLISDDDKLINDESIEDIDPENNYLKKLKQEHEILIKRFDDRIEKFQIEIQEMNCNLKELIIQKHQKQNEFIQMLNEHKRKMKNKKQNQNRQKSIKRINQTTPRGGGRK